MACKLYNSSYMIFIGWNIVQNVELDGNKLVNSVHHQNSSLASCHAISQLSEAIISKREHLKSSVLHYSSCPQKNSSFFWNLA